jgi:hypothetical protein
VAEKAADPQVTVCPTRYLEGYSFTPFMDEFKKIDADGWFSQQKKRQDRNTYK